MLALLLQNQQPLRTMLKSMRLGLVAFAAVGFLASCKSDAAADAATAAESTVESTTEAVNMSTDPMADPNAAAAVPTGPTTEMTFSELEYDFGTVPEGEKVRHTYKFKNTGSEPLVLSNASGSCGCTVPEWPREPIAPGASGEIIVEFNSQGKAGDRNQKVTVTANTNPAQTILSLKGKVEPAAGSAQPAG